MLPSFHFIKVVLCNRGVGTYEDFLLMQLPKIGKALPIFGSCNNQSGGLDCVHHIYTRLFPTNISDILAPLDAEIQHHPNYELCMGPSRNYVVLVGEGVGYPKRQFTVVTR